MIGQFGKARQSAQRIEPIVEHMDLHRRIPAQPGSLPAQMDLGINTSPAAILRAVRTSPADFISKPVAVSA